MFTMGNTGHAALGVTLAGSNCMTCHAGTYLGAAVRHVEENHRNGYDRLVVISDEQSHDHVQAPSGKGYVINVASNRNGVGYGEWTHIDGWSEAVMDYIAELENA